MQKPAPIDLAHLARYTGGDKKLGEEILRLFEEQCDVLIGRMEEAVAGLPHNPKPWLDAAHSLKGSSRGIGAFAMADAAADAEAAHADRTGAVQALKRLKENVAPIVAFIKQTLETR